MLGSLTDAEDTLQETMLAAWRGLAGFEERSSLRSWLYRIPHRGDQRMSMVPARANTQPALGAYLSDHEGSAALPNGLFVLTMAGDKIRAITRFHLDELYPRFGLAGSLPEPRG
jgi:hypothetical protein